MTVGAVSAARETRLAIGAVAAVAAHQVPIVVHRIVVVRLHHASVFLLDVLAVLVGAVETWKMTFVVVLIVCAVVAVHGAQQFGAQIDRHIGLGVVVLIVLIVNQIVFHHVGGIARRHDGVAL